MAGISVPFSTAASLAGGITRLRRGVKASTFSNWKKLGVPWNVLGPILLEQRTEAVSSAVHETSVPYVAPEWQDREWQQTHAFTALVEALRDLERIPMTSVNAWRARIAWETVLSAGEVVRTLSSWKDRDWERIHRKGLDHWLRPKFGSRAERTMLKERLSIQLELEEED